VNPTQAVIALSAENLTKVVIVLILASTPPLTV
jgi:hypothetical protein